jgi:hypothetical protein
MTKLALALGTILVVGSASIGFAGAGEGSPDINVPSRAEYYGTQTRAYTSAPVAARSGFETRNVAPAPSFNDGEKAWIDRASRPYGG